MTIADLPLGPGPGFWIVCAGFGAVAAALWAWIKVWTWFRGLSPTIEQHAQQERTIELHEKRISALETTTPAVFMEQMKKVNVNLEELARRMDEDHRRRKHG